MENKLELYKKCIQGPWVTSGNDVQYRIEETENKIYVIFQYTASEKDWKQNFKFWPILFKTNYSKYFAHTGFVEDWKSIEKEIGYEILSSRPTSFFSSVSTIPYIDYLDKNKELIFTGFSMGGAISILAYLFFSELYFKVSCYAFGVPNVLFLPNHKHFKNAELYYIIVKGDLVTYLPFGFLGYSKIGKVIKLGKFKLMPLPKYHEINNYIKELEIYEKTNN